MRPSGVTPRHPERTWGRRWGLPGGGRGLRRAPAARPSVAEAGFPVLGPPSSPPTKGRLSGSEGRPPLLQVQRLLSPLPGLGVPWLHSQW